MDQSLDAQFAWLDTKTRALEYLRASVGDRLVTAGEVSRITQLTRELNDLCEKIQRAYWPKAA